MKIEIKASPKEVKDGHFDYSNMKSEYGCNTLFFTKNGKPYSIIAGEMHFARLPKERWKETLLKMWRKHSIILCFLELPRGNQGTV